MFVFRNAIALDRENRPRPIAVARNRVYSLGTMKTLHMLLSIVVILGFTLVFLTACANGRKTKAEIKVGSPAPDFTLTDHTGKQHGLADYRGQWVLLYFYPKNDTPGCTTEACSFRDNYADFKDRNVAVLGINPDSVESHREFAEKYNLTFPLLADTDRAVVNAYGVWGMLGGTVPLTARRSFLIDPDGKIAKLYPDVDPSEHVEEILQDLDKLQND